MCGIAGIHIYRGDAVVEPAELDAIRDALAPRGPDGAGSFLSPDRRTGLAHRRLSILDLSERGAQPMASDDGAHVVVFNGEIYNHRALRAELEARGHRFRSTSDTEVLLALYREHAEGMFERLRGMYAFALWDRARRGLLVGRDPYGIKPLYLADDGRAVRLASQVKALLRGRVPREHDAAGLAGFYLFGSVPEPHTRYRAIRALEAGCHQWFGEDGARSVRRHHALGRVFREAARRPACVEPVERERRVAAALADSVRHHLESDVPVGAFLSAGIDSGALVALMRHAGSLDVRTITLAFEALRGTAEDEAPLAEAVARRYETNHTTVRLSGGDLLGARDAFLAAMDQPSVDGLNTWLVSRAAHEAGLKVAVSGLGGDELFGGYPSFRDVPRWATLLGPAERLPRLGLAVERAFAAVGPRRVGVSPKAASLLRYGGTFPGAYLLRRGLFMPAELPALMGAELAAEGLARLEPLAHVARALEPDPVDPFARVAVLEASLYMRNQLLRDSDWASMAHGLEVRVPLVDATLAATVAPLLVPGGGGLRPKEWLARAPRSPLPHEVVARRKSGFFVPVAPLLERQDGVLDAWRRVPSLARPEVHWARRMAYALVASGAV